jgi:hypothetical protein
VRADCDLVWYYNDSPAALGLSSAPLSPEPRDSLPQQKWPSAKQCADVRRQKLIREALRQLSPRLQCILECAYEARGITLQDNAEFDLCAPLMARIMQRLRLCRSAEDKEKLKEIAESAPGGWPMSSRPLRKLYTLRQAAHQVLGWDDSRAAAQRLKRLIVRRQRQTGDAIMVQSCAHATYVITEQSMRDHLPEFFSKRSELARLLKKELEEVNDKLAELKLRDNALAASIRKLRGEVRQLSASAQCDSL